MATKIVTKNSSTAGAAPTATDLVQGELAVNVADGRLYTEDNAAAIVELGVNPATEITANAGIALPDSQKATFGAGDDLQIYHDGSNSVIKDAGTGNLKVLVEDLRINNSSDTAAILSGDRGGAVTLYNNGSPKIATTSTGIDVTGSVTADGAVNSTYFTGGSSSIAGRQLTLSCEDGTGGQDNATHRLTVPSGYGSFATSVGGAERMRIDSSGNVGIGTSSPNRNLHVSGGASDVAFGITNSASGTAASDGFSITVENPTTDVAIRQRENANMKFLTNNAERMRIDSSGNLLVGTTDNTLYNNTSGSGIMLAASGRIDVARVQDVCAILNRTGASDGSIMDLKKNGTTVGSIGTQGGSRLTIGNGDTGLRIAGDLNTIVPWNTTTNLLSDSAIDLGQSNQRFKDLYLSGAAFANYVGSASDTNTNIAFDTADTIRFTNGALERMRITSNGRLLVGTTVSSAKITVSNTGVTGTTLMALTDTGGTGTHTQISFNNTNGQVGKIDTAGSTTTYATSSDQRLKDNIADADDAGSKIDAIQVRKFDWKADGEHQDYGMIAQELLTVEPRAVAQGETKEDMMAVDYSQLVPMLIKEIQSLRNRVAQLETGV